ncbi:hypothetical protein PYW07_006047 [Mythimna separata]|uniref:ABC transporter domain-containing protein n=1 Tax=Mythimna separata TaxID=271217 RepID=A0AAD7YJ82_MYTSE|nr:hypothetical protein PYW07_006047 [Mythimna separata]
MRIRVFSVLMWKHAMVRRRRFINTFMDLFTPLLFFVLIFLIQRKLSSILKSGKLKDGVINTEVLSINDLEPAPFWIMYNPATELTNALMEDIGRKLNLPKLDSNPDHSKRGYFPRGNTTLTDLVKKITEKQALVEFKGLSGSTWPDRLHYTIRMNLLPEPDDLDDPGPGRHKAFGHDYGTFMRIQWAIDSSYIKLRSGKEVPLNLSLQEFPYYNSPRNENLRDLIGLQPLVCLLSLLVPFVFHMVRLMQERTSGIQELMKMVGVSLNTIGLTHYLNVLPIGLVYSIGATIIYKASSHPILPCSNWVLIFLMLFLHYNFVIALAFACSYIMRETNYATSLATVMYTLSWVPTQFFDGRKLPYLVKILTGLLPHMPVAWFWRQITTLEVFGIGANFSNIAKEHGTDGKSAPILVCFGFLLLQTVVFYALAWYLSLVRPGKYGQALPWNFCFKKEVMPVAEEEEEEIMRTDKRYFERARAHAEVGIKIANVSKVYPKHRALRNVSMEVYKGEITVLVGHNGAGKTTLMSIITGMTSATEGQVFVDGKDTVKQKKEVSRKIGFCPQLNLFFPDLTVQEHIMFFTMLKHGTYAEARESSRIIAERLGIADKLRAKTSELSGGMKRRSQLACALAGGATVLVLDEPTSGLDVETRRELWDLLLSLRGERTVLISTHFMEEVDALGDRVAALHGGVLRCFASTLHLKKAIGTGYRLTFTTFGMPNEAAISGVVMAHVPDASVKEQTINSISYNLPATHSGNFPALFSDLEARRSQLGLDSIGVGVSTLEEVFLRLCSDIDTSLTEDEVDTSVEPAQPPKKLTGILLYMRQLYVLLKRQTMFSLYRKWIFLAQIIIPIVLSIGVTHSMNSIISKSAHERTMNLDIYNERVGNRLLYQLSGPHVTQADLAKLQTLYPKVKFQEADDVAATILNIGKELILNYNKYLVGVEVNETDAKILYTTIVRHAAPVSLNLLSNLLAAHYIPGSDGNTITTINDPISTELSHKVPKQPKPMINLIMWATFICFLVMMMILGNIALPCQERLTGSRHIHIMSGCPPELHWLATLIFHSALCVLLVIIPTVVGALILEKDETINQKAMLGTFALIMLLGHMTFSALGYLVTFNFHEQGTGAILTILVVIFGTITPLLKIVYVYVGDTESQKELLQHVVEVANYIMPPHTMVIAAVKCVYAGQLNAWCKAVKEYCPALLLTMSGFDSTKCCAGQRPRCYFCIHEYSPGLEMIILFVQFLVLMAMVFLTQRGFFNGLVDKLVNSRYQPSEPKEQDKMVKAEKAYVSKAIKTADKNNPDAMLVDDVHKNYPGFCTKKVNALKGVSFSVKKGECFGLLGTNGAGKSTCFKIMTTEETATRGNIFGNGYHLRRGNSQYLQTLGYCPQFFGLDMFQTGEENLAMVLTLRGFDRARVEEEVKNWLHIIGLEKYASRHVATYSGGCVRRLGAAASLCGGSDLSLLDEPTAGVDVVARRRLWTALRKALKQKRSIIITSHSMDEMEALCSRIAILTAGRVRALGTTAGLRKAYAAGHAVVFKLLHAHHLDEVDSAKTQVYRLKGMLQETFNCTLKDEHKTMLHYHINDAMPYSVLFKELENLRNEFPTLIEDYAITETTLEEVFLSFAKEEQQQGAQAV